MAIAEVAPSISTFLGSCAGGLYKRRHPLPECRIEMRVDISGEFLPLRIKGLKLCGGHASVFGRIQSAAMFQSDVGEAVKQVEAHFFADRKIERQRDPRLRERKHSG